MGGELPDLRTGADLDFTLTLGFQDLAAMISPQDLIVGLSGTAGTPMDFSAVTGSLDQDMASKLTTPGRGFALQASINVYRPAGATYFVREINVTFQAELCWIPVDSLNLTGIALTVRAYRETAESAWELGLTLKGDILVDTIPASVLAKIIIGNTSRAEITVNVQQWSGLTADVFLDTLIAGRRSTAGGTIVTAIDGIPPSLSENSYITESTASPLSAAIVIEKIDSLTTWDITSIDLNVAIPGYTWCPIPTVQDTVNISLRKPCFQLHARRKANDSAGSAPAAAATGFAAWNFSGRIGAILSLCKSQYQIPVFISYDSETKLTEIGGSLPDDLDGDLEMYGELDYAALDSGMNPARGKRLDLFGSAKAHPVPDESPLPLSNISKAGNRAERGVVFWFDQTTLTRVRFKVDYEKDPAKKTWQLTTDLAITNLGIIFEVENPRNGDNRKLAGYVYGKARVGEKTDLFAFVAGMSSKEANEFWVGFSVDYDPNGSLGVAAIGVISDRQFAGTEVRAPDAAKWDIQSFPVNPDSVLRSVSAKLVVKFVKDKTEGEGSTRKTRLSQVKVQLTVEGNWPICDGLNLTGAHLNVLLDRTAAGHYDWSVELFGIIERNGYLVEFLANVGHDSETTKFEVQVGLKKMDDTSKAIAASPAAVTEMGLFGTVRPGDSELAGQIPGK